MTRRTTIPGRTHTLHQALSQLDTAGMARRARQLAAQ